MGAIKRKYCLPITSFSNYTLGKSKINKPVHKRNQGYLLRWIQFLIPGSGDPRKEHFFILTSNQDRKFFCPLVCFQVFSVEEPTGSNSVEKLQIRIRPPPSLQLHVPLGQGQRTYGILGGISSSVLKRPVQRRIFLSNFEGL